MTVMPVVLRMASLMSVIPSSSIRVIVTLETDCGVSRAESASPVVVLMAEDL